ncbi:MAG TPA: imidazole glycerol phosphate synthase subunit HisH [Labilithrix sp.]
MRIVVCDPGASNVRSVVRAVEKAAGAAPIVTAEPDVVRSADVVVVPGQGAFGPFARAIEGGLGEALVETIRAGRPYLGICLGLQVLFETSEEAPGAKGLGILRGHVRRLRPGAGMPLPHIGWNAVARAGEPTRHFYFAHSFVAAPEDAGIVHATTEYGETFASAIAHEAIAGVQFHPEKSQREGLALLARFFERKHL